jgi:amidase
MIQKLLSSPPPSSDPFAALDATAQAELVRTGRASALELVEAAIGRIERLNPKVNAVASASFDKARERARTALLSGPFAGVPTLIKDLLPYPGHKAEFGSRLFSGNVAQAGSDYTQALHNSGLIVLGKTTTSEFGLLGTTETAACGATRNPWDLGLSTGGSSGGSVAAVASGMVPIAHASDGGGAIRGPASLCGLFGFKPSRSRTWSAGVPDSLPTARFLSDHCVSRSVRDSAAWLEITERTDAEAPLRPVGKVERALTQCLTFGVYRCDGFGREPSPEADAALMSAVRLCENLGHILVETGGPRFDVQITSSAFFALSGVGLAGLLDQMRTLMGTSFDDSLIEPYTRELVARGRRLAPADLLRATGALDAAQNAADKEMARFDVLLCPTVDSSAFPLGQFGPTADPDLLISFTERVAGYTFGASLAGWPAMSVPLHWSQDALPIGCHFAAPMGEEARLLGLALQLEEAAPWRDRWPPCSEH